MALKLAISLLVAFSLQAQEGHWEGTIQVPNREVKFTIDLSKNAKQEWVGQWSFVGGGPQNLDLSDISVTGGDITLTLGLPNKPTLKGKLRPEDNSITGMITQGGNDASFTMKRTGEAKIVPPVPSLPLSSDAIGTWEGTVDMGRPLRLVMNLKNDAAGLGSGTIVSLDQGGAEIPMNSIRQEGMKLDFDLKMVGGSYKGSLSEDKSEIKGEWTQMGNTAPLNFKRKSADVK